MHARRIDDKVVDDRFRQKPVTVGGVFLRPSSAIKTPVRFSPTQKNRNTNNDECLSNSSDFYLKSANANDFIHRKAKL